jgi:anaerobic selenocysteine-containing dehydrogenase
VLRRIATESGPEAVAFGVTTSSGTALSDAQPWVDRLINAFGSPNNCNSMEICAWHRQFARAFTTGTGIGMPDYAQAGSILLWGHNPSTSLLAAATRIVEARARGATTPCCYGSAKRDRRSGIGKAGPRGSPGGHLALGPRRFSAIRRY